MKNPDNFDPLKVNRNCFSVNYYCEKNKFSAQTFEEILENIEKQSSVEICIDWKLIERFKRDAFHEYKNSIIQNTRQIAIDELLKKFQFTLWNGDLINYVKVGCNYRQLYLPESKELNYPGYKIDIVIAAHLMEFEEAFKSILLLSKAKYSMIPSRSLWEVESLLERRPTFAKLSPEKQTLLQEMMQNLPHIKNDMYCQDIKGVPRLYWLNYWDAETAAFYNFPDPELDAHLVPLAEQLPNGGWVFKLTEEPLDINRADHREAIIWAYQRFKPVGMTVKEYEIYHPPKPPTPTPKVEEFLAKAEASLNGLPPEERKQAEANLDNFKEVLNKLGKSNLKK